MVTVYGLPICPHTAKALEVLKEAGVAVDFKNFAADTQNLKDFLKLRDDSAYRAIFDPVRAAGGIGIPLFVFSDGTVTKDLDEVLKKASPQG